MSNLRSTAKAERCDRTSRHSSAAHRTTNLTPVIVTDEMVKAGLSAMNELPRDEDPGYVVTSIFLAMEYRRQSLDKSGRILERVLDEGERQ
jgi:hypothetical protein